MTHPYSWPEVRRGAERIVAETARALARRGHDVTVITAGQAAAVRSTDGHRTVRLRRRHDDAEQHERWFATAIAPRLVTGRFDVVHSLYPRDALTAVRTRPLGGHRVVYEELGIPWAFWWAPRADRLVREKVVAGVDDYGCMSRAALRVLHQDHDRAGVLIPGGVRLDQFAIAPARAERPTVLFSGALTEPRKGLALLLTAFDLVARKEPDAQLWLSGPGDPSALLAAAPAATRERTTLLPLGEPDEQGERYARAWATALPSYADSFGMVLVESLASGTPIVVGDDGAPPELVTDGTGVVVGLDDPERLACGLLEAFRLAEDRESATRCRATAMPFDWDTGIAPRLEVIYRGEGVDPVDAELAPRRAIASTVAAGGNDAHSAPLRDADGEWCRFVAEHVPTGARTLEVGSGMSTVLLAMLGARHRCFSPSTADVNAVRARCREWNVDVSNVTFDVTPPSAVLPTLGDAAYDVVLLDCSRGYVAPLIDWFYGAQHLRLSGVLVVDHVSFPLARVLVDALERDTTWVRLRRTTRWAAFERRSEGPIDDEVFAHLLPADMRSSAERWLRARLRPVRDRVESILAR